MVMLHDTKHEQQRAMLGVVQAHVRAPLLLMCALATSQAARADSYKAAFVETQAQLGAGGG